MSNSLLLNKVTAFAFVTLITAVRGLGQSSYTFEVFAGGDAGFADGASGAAQFSQPRGLAVDVQGNVYVADTGNKRIREVSPTGIVTTVDPGPSVSFSKPTGVAVDASGNLYVADAGSGDLIKIQRNGPSSAILSHFQDPVGVAVGPNNAVYVADAGPNVALVSDSSQRVFGAIGGSGNATGQLSAIAVDSSGNVYLQTIGAVPGVQSTMIRVSGGAATVIRTNLGGAADLVTPLSVYNGVAVDGTGNVFLTDGPTRFAAGIGTKTISSVDELPANAGSFKDITLQAYSSFTQPRLGPAPTPTTGIAVDIHGNIYYCANSMLLRGTPSGNHVGSVPLHSVKVNQGGEWKLTLSTVEAAAFDPDGGGQWFKNGALVQGAAGQGIEKTAAASSDSGVYTFRQADGAPGISFAVGVDTSPGATFLDGSVVSTPFSNTSLYTSVAYDGRVFAVTGAAGDFWTSSDGTVWTKAGAVAAGINSLIASGTSVGFVGVGNAGEVVSASGSPLAFVSHPSGTSGVLTGVATGGGMVVAVGFGGVAVISADGGLTWHAVSTGTTADLNAVAYGNGKFVAVGVGGTIISSVDGSSWALQTSGLLDALYSIAFGRNSFVAVGSNGSDTLVAVSPDGSRWIQEGSISGSAVVRLAFGSGMFVGVGNGPIVSSSDGGLSWSKHATAASDVMEGAAFGSGKFVVAGNHGLALVSSAGLSRLINLSARGMVGTGANALVAGFVIGGGSGKQVLLRGIGPALGQFGISGALSSARLDLFAASGAQMDSNSGWGGGSALSTVFSQVGAFALPAGSADAALLETLTAGSHTVQEASANGSTGIGLAELYDADATQTGARLINISARAQIAQGQNVLVAGFVVTGNTGETILVRGIGPSLVQFGVASALQNPALVLRDHTGLLIASNSGWTGSNATAATFSQLGAFALPAGSADAALVASVSPGIYMAELTDSNGGPGVGLLELYEVPQSGP